MENKPVRKSSADRKSARERKSKIEKAVKRDSKKEKEKISITD
jgi:hypothetical protein